MRGEERGKGTGGLEGALETGGREEGGERVCDLGRSWMRSCGRCRDEGWWRRCRDGAKEGCAHPLRPGEEVPQEERLMKAAPTP